ncbi:WD40 repeat domain-containing protein [Streptomyces sp. WSLK1-5]|uniref:WD40 repeat domain-containing protein n=1 Tax=unclassified Streptomyces TaxID=2593676 RepID=UPI0037ABFC0A
MRRPFALLAGILLVGAFTVPASAADGDGKGDRGFTISDPRITESSGLAASRQHPGIYWTHNDQDTGAYLYAVDSATGRTVARITMTGVGTPRDVEAIAVGPGNEIWVGDIGDNDGVTWPYVWIYKLPEPKDLKDQSVKATQYVVKYSDGSRDAESMVVHPKTGRVYIIDKQEDGGHLYAGPATLSPSGANVFKPAKAVDLWATDAAFSPDGRRLTVRGYFGGIWYDWNGGDIKRGGRISVPLGQGESVSYSPDGSRILLGMEGANSQVEAQDAPGGGGSDASSGGGGGSSSAAGSGDGDSSTGTLKIGVLALGAVAALFGLRRLFRRS